MDSMLMVLCTLAIGLLIWKTSNVVKKYRRYIQIYSSEKVITYGKFHPIWGHLHLFKCATDIAILAKNGIAKTGKKITCYWMLFFYPVIGVCHADTAKVILKSTEPKNKQTGGGYFSVLPWLGDGLLLSDGRKWERNRKLLTPAFHFDVLKPYVVLYNEVFDIFLNKLEEATSGGKSVDICDTVGLATLDTLLRCALSYDGKVQEQGWNHPYVHAVRRLGSLSFERMLKPWYHPDFVFKMSALGKEFYRHTKYIHEFDEKVINERKRLLSADPSVLGKRYLDFLDILLTAKDDNGVALTDREIRDEVDTFLFEGIHDVRVPYVEQEMLTGPEHLFSHPDRVVRHFAGHDTTASSLSWAIYSLSQHQEEQAKVYEEVRRIVGDKPHVEWSDIQEFSRLSLFLKESMRMYAPVPCISRLTTREIELDGLTIPANMEVHIQINAMNHRVDVWGDPEVFRPMRFVDDTERDPYSCVPFSAGPRNCIGQHFALNEQKVALAKLIQRFRVLPDTNHQAIIDLSIVMRSKNGIRIKLEKR